MLERKRLLKVKEQLVRDGQRVFIYEQPATGDVFTIIDPRCSSTSSNRSSATWRPARTRTESAGAAGASESAAGVPHTEAIARSQSQLSAIYDIRSTIYDWLRRRAPQS